MSKNSKDIYGAVGKGNLLQFDPDTLLVVNDENHPLYDARVHLPLVETMVLNIMTVGIVQPIKVRKNRETGEVEVVAGRQRVKHAREANKRLKAAGRPPITVPGVVEIGDESRMFDVLVSENENRQDDTPLGRAEKMQRMASRGVAEADIAIVFGCTVQTVRSSLSLLDCSAPVKAAVEAGKIQVSHAYKLAKLSVAEQKEKLSELTSATEGKNGRQKSKAARKVMDRAPSARSRAEIAARAKRVNGEAAAVLAWVLGGDWPEAVPVQEPEQAQ